MKDRTPSSLMNLLGSTLVFIWNEFPLRMSHFFAPPLGRYLLWDIGIDLGFYPVGAPLAAS